MLACKCGMNLQHGRILDIGNKYSCTLFSPDTAVTLKEMSQFTHHEKMDYILSLKDKSKEAQYGRNQRLG